MGCEVEQISQASEISRPVGFKRRKVGGGDDLLVGVDLGFGLWGLGLPCALSSRGLDPETKTRNFSKCHFRALQPQTLET